MMLSINRCPPNLFTFPPILALIAYHYKLCPTSAIAPRLLKRKGTIAFSSLVIGRSQK
ncbi:hypothetical protein AB3R30_13400 [Leptolyngbyaceae cyanobacterium UHCC 1019]